MASPHQIWVESPVPKAVLDGAHDYLNSIFELSIGATRSQRTIELLKTADAPTDVEIATYREVVTVGSQALDYIEERLESIRAELEAALWARARVASNVEDAKSLSNPMRSLPDDIMFEIFQHCTPSWRSPLDNEDSFDSLDPRQAPWTLTQVCRRWRELACSFAPLWSYLRLDFRRHEGHITQEECAFKTALFLHRSRECDLDVSLCDRELSERGAETYLSQHDVLPYLVASAARWKRLRVDLTVPSLGALRECVCAQVDELRVHFWRAPRPPVTSTIFSNTPNVRTLRIEGGQGGTLAGQTPDVLAALPWDRIIEYEYSETMFSSFLGGSLFNTQGTAPHFLAALNYSNLQQLRIRLSAYVSSLGPGPATMQGEVCLPQLTHLTVHDGAGKVHRLPDVLAWLQMPNLTHLRLIYSHGCSIIALPIQWRAPPTALTDMYLEWSGYANSMDSENLKTFLRTTSNVQNLTIARSHSNYGLVRMLWQCLTIQAFDEVLLPRLQRMGVDMMFCIDDLMPLVLSRTQPVQGSAPHVKMDELTLQSSWMVREQLEGVDIRVLCARPRVYFGSSLFS
ncbi:hypothetical protein CYLTODRAFT_419678 [Cylindrobasidium torrendii FP15055 ss-10]|uniref:Uncharacterized protein n=1 Tax=Cylindrobasidium torrendii FP15055 ss-10 TaxID=1314674 RepID=A0A0D7BJC9_9AGAR|nr:hypothetical protein CYLTODRAFT_419678 [Cylindrobasidium torrendii FP15055 ss-10]